MQVTSIIMLIIKFRVALASPSQEDIAIVPVYTYSTINLTEIIVEWKDVVS